MPMPVITTAEVEKLVWEALNVSKTTYGTYDGTVLFKEDNITDIIHQGDIEVCKMILRTPGHPRRQEYLLTKTIGTPGVSVPVRDTNHHVGGLARVDITRNDAKVVVGKTAPAHKITAWLLDKTLYGGDECIDGYYDYTDGVFIFTGLSASLSLENFSTHTTTDVNLFAPFEYKHAIVHYALKELLMKDPARVSLREEYNNAWMMNVQEITGMNPMVPPITEYQKAR